MWLLRTCVLMCECSGVVLLPGRCWHLKRRWIMFATDGKSVWRIRRAVFTHRVLFYSFNHSSCTIGAWIGIGSGRGEREWRRWKMNCRQKLQLSAIEVGRNSHSLLSACTPIVECVILLGLNALKVWALGVWQAAPYHQYRLFAAVLPHWISVAYSQSDSISPSKSLAEWLRRRKFNLNIRLQNSDWLPLTTGKQKNEDGEYPEPLLENYSR